MKRFYLALLALFLLTACNMNPASPPADMDADLAGLKITTAPGVTFLRPVGREHKPPEATFDASLELYLKVFGFVNGTPSEPVGPDFATADGSISVEDGIYRANLKTGDLHQANDSRLRLKLRLKNDSNNPACNGGIDVHGSGCLAYFDVLLAANRGASRNDPGPDTLVLIKPNSALCPTIIMPRAPLMPSMITARSSASQNGTLRVQNGLTIGGEPSSGKTAQLPSSAR